MPVRRKLICELVDEILEANRITDAPVPVDRIAKAEDIEISLQDAEDDISGFIVRDPEHKRVVIGINSKHHPNRRRFTTAHELGHYFLHPGEDVHVDKTRHALRINLRDKESSTGTRDTEKEANLFAAELLMPSSFLQSDLERMPGLDLLTNDRALAKLARKYKVSTEALTFRLAYLGCIET